MAEGEDSSSSNDHIMRSEGFHDLNPDERMQDGSAAALAELRAYAESNPDDDVAKQLADRTGEPENRPQASEPAQEATLPAQSPQPSVPPTESNERHALMAQAYAEKSPEDAVAEHPELAKVYAARAAVETQVADRPQESQNNVMAHFDARAIEHIESGKLPTVQLNEKVTQEVAVEREPQFTA